MRGKIGALLAAVVAAVAGLVGAAGWARRRQGGDELDLEVTEPAVTPGVSPADVQPSVAAPEPVAATAPEPVAATAPEPVAATAPEPVAATAATIAPAAADELTAIKGLGKVKASRLVAAGITTYAQIAAWSDEDIAEIGLKVNTSPGQIKREDWVGQAKALAEG
ncbi:MAG: helix-hairpin-helix domain-containing protein [Chloroflexota bacterium]|jgi:predicted flap endonuclease-1-like 5' DNA nuclease